LLDDPPEEAEAPLLPELAAPERLAGAELELLPDEPPEPASEDLLPELSDDEPDLLAEESPEPDALASPPGAALASPPAPPEEPAAASEPATGTAASLVLAPPLPLLRKSVTYHPEPFN